MDIKNDIHIMEMNDKLYQRLKQSELVIHAKVESVFPSALKPKEYRPAIFRRSFSSIFFRIRPFG